MAFTTGAATDHHDLLNKLRLYLVAQGWTQLAWTAPVLITDQAILKMRGPGAGAGKQVFINIRSWADTVLGAYSWEIRGAVNYDALLPWGSQLSESPQNCFFNTWQNAMTYWFFVNDRRFVVVAKCSTNYMSMHAGFVLPWGTPDQYPFPLLVAGDFYERQPSSYAFASRRMFVDPGRRQQNLANPDACAYMRSPTGTWYPIGQHAHVSNNNAAQSNQKLGKGFIWPYHAGSYNGISIQHYPATWNAGSNAGDHAYAFESLVPTQQNERPLLPTMVCAGDQAPFGVIDGVYCVGGSGLATEQLLTIGARNFRVFQNIGRNSGDDFFCVEEV